MGNIILALLKSLNKAQIVTFLFMTAAPVIIHAILGDTALASQLVTLAASIGSTLLVVLRKPSDQGGTVKTQLDGK